MDATSVFAMNSDAAYSLLYQNKTMVELLLRSWAPPDVADDIDYGTLREESPKHYDGEGHLRVGDLVWSFRMRSGELVWAAILLEFQSTPDPMLPWRLLSYASLFWRRVESAGRLQDGKLPALFPIVLLQRQPALERVPAYGRLRWRPGGVVPPGLRSQDAIPGY